MSLVRHFVLVYHMKSDWYTFVVVARQNPETFKGLRVNMIFFFFASHSVFILQPKYEKKKNVQRVNIERITNDCVWSFLTLKRSCLFIFPPVSFSLPCTVWLYLPCWTIDSWNKSPRHLTRKAVMRQSVYVSGRWSGKALSWFRCAPPVSCWCDCSVLWFSNGAQGGGNTLTFDCAISSPHVPLCTFSSMHWFIHKKKKKSRKMQIHARLPFKWSFVCMSLHIENNHNNKQWGAIENIKGERFGYRAAGACSKRHRLSSKTQGIKSVWDKGWHFVGGWKWESGVDLRA